MLASPQLILQSLRRFLCLALSTLHLRPRFGRLLFHTSYAVKLQARNQAHRDSDDPKRECLVRIGCWSGHFGQNSHSPSLTQQREAKWP